MFEIQAVIHYRTSGFKTGNQTRSMKEFHERVPVLIKNADDLEAPVAATWNDVIEAVYPYFQTTSRHVRVHEGRFYRPLMNSAESTPVSAAEFSHNAANASDKVFPASQDANWAGSHFTGEGSHYEQIYGSGRQSALKRALEFADRLLVVDGVMYERCEAPHIVIAPFVSYDGPAVHGRRVLHTDASKNLAITTNKFPVSATHPVHHIDEYKTLMTKCRVANGRLPEIEKERSKLVNEALSPIITPEGDAYFPSRVDLGLRALAARMTKFMNEIWGKVHDIDREIMNAYFDIFESVERLPDENAYAVIEDAAGILADRFRGRESSDIRFIHSFEFDVFDRMIALCQQRDYAPPAITADFTP